MNKIISFMKTLNKRGPSIDPSAYGVSDNSVSLLKSYLSNRKQQIKVNSVLSNWADIHKGVPHNVVWHPCPRRKAHKKGLNNVSKKSDNCVSNTFSKILEKTGRTFQRLLIAYHMPDC
jgi:hypothetical protein